MSNYKLKAQLRRLNFEQHMHELGEQRKKEEANKVESTPAVKTTEEKLSGKYISSVGVTRELFNNKDFRKEFQSVSFVNCNFEGCNFTSARFKNCSFFQCTFKNCDLSNLTLKNSYFKECVINGVRLVSTEINPSTFINCKGIILMYAFNVELACYKSTIGYVINGTPIATYESRLTDSQVLEKALLNTVKELIK